MEVRYGEEVANRSGPESCGYGREGVTEALTGETDRQGTESRNQESGTPTLSCAAEGNTEQDANRKSCNGPARSETPGTSGSSLRRSWEVSSAPVSEGAGGAGKVHSRNPAANADEKSDTSIVPRRPPNKGIHPAEAAEGRDVAKGNTDKIPAPRTQSRTSRASMGLEGVREAARRDRRLRFTAFLHHITPALLAESFYALQRQASAGVDGETWREHERVLRGGTNLCPSSAPGCTVWWKAISAATRYLRT